MKTIFLIVGETASGKDTLVNMLVEKEGYKKLISYATRPRRDGEGDTHIFIKPEEVQNYIDNMVAYTKIGDYEYFATKQQVEDADLYIIDPTGIDYLKSNIKNVKFITISIFIDTITRLARAEQRGDDVYSVSKRMISELKQFDKYYRNVDYDYLITNKDIDKSFSILKTIIEQERK
jgi:guanylate kinase